MATATETLAPSITAEPEGLYEVVNGQVVEKPPMGAFESELACILMRLMDDFARTHGLGRAVAETLFRIAPGKGLERRPDVAFVSHQTWPLERRAPRTAVWEVVPDLAVEVISPTNRTVDDLQKVDDYFHAGARAVWLVVPTFAKVYVYDSPTPVKVLARGDELDGGAVLPGFRLALATFFGEPAE
jgi:Uma2 family endonuclease